MNYSIARSLPNLYLCLILLLSTFCVTGQIVEIKPTFFSLDEEITIRYNAKEGSGGLIGVNQVYMHTGIITRSGGAGNWKNVQGNWGTDDPKVKMTNVGDDFHELSFIPRDFYDISPTDEVLQLSFVFRNIDGSKEGKTASIEDIFVDVPDLSTFSYIILNPTERSLIKKVGETIELDIALSDASSLQLFDNEELLYDDITNKLKYTIDITTIGDHLLEIVIENNGTTYRETISYVVIEEQVEIVTPPFDLKMGLNRISDTQSILAIQAPQKEHVFVIGDFNNWSVSSESQMNLSGDLSTYWIQLDNLEGDTWYGYQYIIDGEIKVADPYSYLILDDRNDESIAPSLNSVPHSYPSGKTSGHVSIFTTNQDGYEFSVPTIDIPDASDLVIYELLLRDFLDDHSINSLTDTLDYLQELGVNAIELMPVSEFENNDSWGYNPSYHMALDKYYGSIVSMKRFVDEAHKRGIAVILDIVYNHAFGQSPLVRMYWDSEQNRPASNSPYFFTEARHPFNVGFDFNHDSPLTKRFVKQTTQYWVEEFNVDGFRFDLSKGFTSRQSTNDGDFRKTDQNRIATLTDYANHLWDINPDLIMILEHFGENAEEKILSDRGFLLWGNGNHNFNEATMGYHGGSKSDFAHLYHENRSWTNPHLVGYMESHDEERLMYKNKKYGNASGSYNVKDESTALKRNEMAAAFFFAIPGPKMFWQFGELGFDYSINTCENGSVSENCRLSRKPIVWDYLEESGREDLRTVYSQMINLKKTHPAIQRGEADLNVRDEVKSITLTHEEGNIIVVGNFNVIAESTTLTFPHNSGWYEFFTGEEIIPTDGQVEFSLDPGEYHIYLDNAELVSNDEVDLNTQEIVLYPNPSSKTLHIESAKLFSSISQNHSLQILDLSGRTIYTDLDYQLEAIDIGSLANGIYTLQIASDNSIYLGKFIKM